MGKHYGYRPNKRGGRRVLLDGLVPKPPKKPYRGTPLELRRPVGRRSWLYAANPLILRAFIDRLNQEKTLLKLTQLQRVLGLSYATLLRFLEDGQIAPVEQPVRWHPARGHETLRSRRQHYYDPLAVISVLQRRLNSLGSELVNMEAGAGWGQLDLTPREAPGAGGRVCQAAWSARWSAGDLESLIEEAAELGQWLTPKETAAWLGVTKGTLQNWRDRFVATRDRARYPPYHQGPDLVPSCARDPETGLRTPTTLRAAARESSFRRRFDPVLYDRNEVCRWLRGLLAQK